MTTITATADSIEMSGHSGYADRGSDIVCAAISAITGALILWCRRHEDEAEVCDIDVADDANVRIRYVPRGDRREWTAAWEVALCGFVQVAGQYPDHAKLII